MATCKMCGQPVTAGVVCHPECLERPSGWISVADRLPDIGKQVLVYDSRTKDCYTAKLFRDYHGFGWDAIGFAVTISSTRWMPLPEPPGEEGKL